MVGGLIVTHGNLAYELLKAAQKIEATLSGIEAVPDDSRNYTEAPRGRDGFGIAVNGYDILPILGQARSQLACSTTDLKDSSALGREESFNEVVGITRFELHLSAF